MFLVIPSNVELKVQKCNHVKIPTTIIIALNWVIICAVVFELTCSLNEGLRTMPVCRVIKVSNHDYKFKGMDGSNALLNASQRLTKLTSKFFPKLEKNILLKMDVVLTGQ